MRTYPSFLVTRSSTGIDDSSYPGLYTLIADYFGPNLRGKVYGVLQLAQPLGYLIGMILALLIAPMIGGWRSVFYITGSLGLVIAAFIYFGVKEMPRGKAEPEFENLAEMQTFHFSWQEAKEIFKKKKETEDDQNASDQVLGTGRAGGSSGGRRTGHCRAGSRGFTCGG